MERLTFYLISGPPESGKGAVATIIEKRITMKKARVLSLSTGIRYAIAGAYNFPIHQLREVWNDRDAFCKPREELLGQTLANVAIMFVTMLRELHGREVLSDILIKRINTTFPHLTSFIIPDADNYADRLAIRRGFPEARFVRIHLSRDGRVGDTSHSGETFYYEIDNSGGINELKTKVWAIIDGVGNATWD